ncbi:unnamed protein product [Enterobius vermicularis]|uniref:Histone-lysine N-methyltransferase SETMAR n=1 Tax=Enterobius vermicularis TaxID=51028 RepID=A0A0N4V7G5_ENTVE|nr:unnamed protein product [Enterobius vermicularis]
MFAYRSVPSLIPGDGCQLEEFEDFFVGCNCLDVCSAASRCSCFFFFINIYDVYENNNSIRESAVELPILECSTSCVCSNWSHPCSNRCVQFGPQLPLEIFLTPEKGFGLRCKDSVQKGQFIAEYAGEVIGPFEVEKRTLENCLNNYIFTTKVRFKILFFYIDARHYGNVARFINHSCEPNLDIVLLRIGTPVVHVALFANRNIAKFEELTYDYGLSSCSKSNSEECPRKCLCGSLGCKGFLPFSLRDPS